MRHLRYGAPAVLRQYSWQPKTLFLETVISTARADTRQTRFEGLVTLLASSIPPTCVFGMVGYLCPQVSGFNRIRQRDITLGFGWFLLVCDSFSVDYIFVSVFFMFWFCSIIVPSTCKGHRVFSASRGINSFFLVFW